jgi:glycerol uptake facilitator-like aquaporin
MPNRLNPATSVIVACKQLHLITAVTMGFLVARKITLQRAFCYWIAQVSSSLICTFRLNLLWFVLQ